jgi:hypothetical protein
MKGFIILAALIALGFLGWSAYSTYGLYQIKNREQVASYNQYKTIDGYIKKYPGQTPSLIIKKYKSHSLSYGTANQYIKNVDNYIHNTSYINKDKYQTVKQYIKEYPDQSKSILSLYESKTLTNKEADSYISSIQNKHPIEAIKTNFETIFGSFGTPWYYAFIFFIMMIIIYAYVFNNRSSRW